MANNNNNINSDNTLEIFETRVKKYKKYRFLIKNNYSKYHKKKQKNDELKKIEKYISKIDKNLLLKKEDFDIFYVNFSNNTKNTDNTITFAKDHLEKIKNCNFSYLLEKLNSININNHFDTKAYSYYDFSSIWLNGDSKYNDFKRLKEWIVLSQSKKDEIIKNASKKIFLFKDAFYKSIDKKTTKQLLADDKQEVNAKKTTKNKKIYITLYVCFFLFLSLTFIFLIIFLVLK